ncbi:glycosyltransferase family 4 protein [Desulfococcaceae bacterium HSG7]|nr:glycosyltransferase family 4 protein [Desulfococcaceae bacterium HSG7]
MPVIIAFGSIPKDGGTFTFYRTLRPKLLEYAIELRCVSVGKHDADLWDSAFADDGCVLLAKEEADVKAQAMAFTEWCAINQADIVMGINSLPILSALPHLPEKIRVMSRCANAFDHGYKITLSCYERLAYIIATTPRLKTDLVNFYGAEESKIRLIPNGISPDIFGVASQRPRGIEKTVRLGFLGRLEHNQKGVLFLPDIIRCLDRKGVDFRFQIAGKGVHGKALKRQLKTYINDGRVTFVGPLQPSSVVDFLSNTDLFVFPSQFEGCPNALLEAMMAGCVPVTFQIKGITDFIVQHGLTGFVCPMADCEAFASRIAELSENRGRLRQMAEAAAYDARERFSQARAAAEYAGLIKDVMQTPPPAWTPLPWSSFQPDPAFANPSLWQRALPQLFRRAINNCLFYIGLSERYYD